MYTVIQMHFRLLLIMKTNTMNHDQSQSIHGTCADPEEETGGLTPPPPLKNHKQKGFSSNTGPDPLKIAATKPAFNVGPSSVHQRNAIHLMAFRWRTDDGPLIVVLGSSIPSST